MVTVILCTYNHCQSLSKTLESLAASRLPASVEWEVLVVDNRSTDQTREIVREFGQRYPGRFRYFYEPHPGKSYALNSGIRESRGEILAFTDDDVTCEPTWLQNLTSSLQSGEWAGAAGRIVLQWPSSIPSWLATVGPYARPPFPDFDLGEEAKELTRPAFGANMAFRKEVFEKFGGFRTDIGPSPSREVPPCHDDTELCLRLGAAGERLRYEPDAVVYHPVPPSRISRSYFLRWWFDEGRASIRAFGVRPGTKWYFAGVPLYLVRSLAKWTLFWIFAGGPRARFYHKMIVWGKLGSIVECYRQRLGDGRQRSECNVQA